MTQNYPSIYRLEVAEAWREIGEYIMLILRLKQHEKEVKSSFTFPATEMGSEIVMCCEGRPLIQSFSAAVLHHCINKS